MTPADGHTDPGFEPVRDAFEANFKARGDVGAQVCVYHQGRMVVDLAGGHVTDPSHHPTGPYGHDTLQMVFSTTKGATALCAHLLAQSGDLDLDAPVAAYWPEFGAGGKENVTVAMLLSHQAGLPDVGGSLNLREALDWDVVCGALAASEPLWEPGTQHGYHAVTFGWLVGEVVRRVSGRSLGTFFADEVAAPLGLEFWIGLPHELQGRVAPLIPFQVPEATPTPTGAGAHAGKGAAGEVARPGLVAALERVLGEGNLLGRALSAPGGAFADELHWNLPEVRAAEIPAANGVTNARSLARMYAAMVGEVDGVRLLSEETLHHGIAPRTDGPDAVLIFPSVFGLGFMRHTIFSPLGSETAFGHYGAGGSVGWADPDRELAFGYVMNKMELGLAGDPRTASLMDALNRCLTP